jgi:hypothetical protein
VELPESVARVGTNIVEKIVWVLGLIAFSQISIMEPSTLLSPFFAKAASSITTRL